MALIPPINFGRSDWWLRNWKVRAGSCGGRRPPAFPLGCRPLSRLLSDSGLMNKPTLLNLWNCDPSVSSPRGRAAHVWTPPPHFWPAFSAATQGDFASFLLSGLGRLARVLGFKGLLIIMDEMERWQDLNWAEQSKAGNLLGGLIWGATARQGKVHSQGVDAQWALWRLSVHNRGT